MKKALILLAILAFVPTVAMGATVYDNFDDQAMDTNLWQAFSEGDVTGTSFYEHSDGRLRWDTQPGWSDGHEAKKGYRSNWGMDLTADFNAQVDFRYHHDSPQKGTDMGKLEFGVFDYVTGVSQNLWIGVENLVTVKPNGHYDSDELYSTNGTLYGYDLYQSEDRGNDFSGRLAMQYDTLADILTLTAYSVTGQTYNEEIAWQYTGIKALGIDHLGIYLAGWSSGIALQGANSYFDNFSATGVMTPEPISAALFLLGAAPLAFARRLKRKKSV